jgi:hypothetical protein|nr:MAG TPA: hypothetical protein [Caudoviricetes sp.]
MRLIDADKIIDSLGNSDMDFAIGGVIDEQPTVFDVDKVVEQLDAYITKLVRRDAVLYKTVMQIVEGGGVE